MNWNRGNQQKSAARDQSQKQPVNDKKIIGLVSVLVVLGIVLISKFYLNRHFTENKVLS